MAIIAIALGYCSRWYMTGLRLNTVLIKIVDQLI